MARLRRGLAIGVSIAIHAAVGAVFVLVRPPRVINEPVVSVRIVSKPAVAPARSEASGSGAIQEEVGPVAPKRRGIKAVLSEGPVVATEGTRDGTVPSTETLAQRETVGNSASVRSDSIDLNLKIDPRGGDPTATIESDAGGVVLKPSGGGTYAYEDTTFDAKIQADGTVEFEDKLIPVPRVGINEFGQPVIEVPLDLTDTLMRAAGDDPYGYEKRKFLAATQEMRGQMAEAACKENLDASLLDIKPRMLAIWENQRLSHGEKKRRLFALWDECAEEGSTDILRMSELIRASILGFIAEHMPPESRLAYSETDLASLNAGRRSRAEFTPYGLASDDR